MVPLTVTPNLAMHRTGNSRLRRLLPAGDRGRYAGWKDIAAGNANVCLRPEAEVAIAKKRTPKLN